MKSIQSIPFLGSLPLLFVLACPLVAAEYPYAPPEAPSPPDPLSLFVRLVSLTAITLAICGGLVWLVRRSTRPTTGPTNSRLVVESQLSFNGRSSIHLLNVDGQSVAVTTDATGIRSIVVLSEPFDDWLNEAA